MTVTTVSVTGEFSTTTRHEGRFVVIDRETGAFTTESQPESEGRFVVVDTEEGTFSVYDEYWATLGGSD